MAGSQLESIRVIDPSKQKRVIVIGATSGIGLAIAVEYLKAGHIVGITGRREQNLIAIQQGFLGTAYIQVMDITKAEFASNQLESLIEKMKGVDIIVVNSGVGYVDSTFDWHKQTQTIATNVIGFSAICSASAKYFISKKSGHLVGISSIASLRGSDLATCYAASKAYDSNYLAGLRKHFIKLGLPIKVTDVLPGFVDTAMGQSKQRFWVSSTEKVAKQITNGIAKQKKTLYVTKRWRLIAWLLKIMPDRIYNRI